MTRLAEIEARAAKAKEGPLLWPVRFSDAEWLLGRLREAQEALEMIRQLIFAGNWAEAEDFARDALAALKKP